MTDLARSWDTRRLRSEFDLRWSRLRGHVYLGGPVERLVRAFVALAWIVQVLRAVLVLLMPSAMDPEPELRAGAVKIDVAWCGICGTDLHEYLEGPIFSCARASAPAVARGILGDPGTTSSPDLCPRWGTGWRALRWATMSSSNRTSWTVTATCARRAATTCAGRWASSGSPPAVAGSAKKIVVDQRWVHPIGDIQLDEAALIEPLSVAHHAVARSGAKAGDVALVGGSGPIGLLTRPSSRAWVSPRSSAN